MISNLRVEYVIQSLIVFISYTRDDEMIWFAPIYQYQHTLAALSLVESFCCLIFMILPCCCCRAQLLPQL